jgi:hypothetical protein
MLCGKIVVVHIARCVVVYFILVCAVSSWASVGTQGPSGESHDVDDDEQQLLSATRPFKAAAENWQRGRHKGYLPIW